MQHGIATLACALPLLVSLTFSVLILFLFVLGAKGERLWGTEKLVQQVYQTYTNRYIHFKTNVVPLLLILPGMCVNPTINMNIRNYSMVQMYMNCLPVYFSSINYLFPFLTER